MDALRIVMPTKLENREIHTMSEEKRRGSKPKSGGNLISPRPAKFRIIWVL